MTAIQVRIVKAPDDREIRRLANDWFVSESLAISNVLENNCVVAGDFRIDSSGHIRFAVFSREGTGDRRNGRVVQRLCEIETYKTMAMLGLKRARSVLTDLEPAERQISAITQGLGAAGGSGERALHELLSVSDQLEALSSRASYRFSATRAYSRIVTQRIEMLRETRFLGNQTFGEFMMRRFDPAMHRVEAVKAQLSDLASRATHAAGLLRTRSDVERAAQNQRLLETMNHRAHQQLRLQQTVEGLSVVAISYYGVNLIAYMLAPFAIGFGTTKVWLISGLTPLVILAVWSTVRRIRRSMAERRPAED